MKTIQQRTSPLRGEITVPGDKSISHRAVMFGSIAGGNTEITGFLPGADCLSTVDCFRRHRSRQRARHSAGKRNARPKARLRSRQSLYRKQRYHNKDHLRNTCSAALHICDLGRRVHIFEAYAQDHFAPVTYGSVYNKRPRK